MIGLYCDFLKVFDRNMFAGRHFNTRKELYLERMVFSVIS